eukprot:4076125-Pleurochrysis_carterae.AAC.1
MAKEHLSRESHALERRVRLQCAREEQAAGSGVLRLVIDEAEDFAVATELLVGQVWELSCGVEERAV